MALETFTSIIVVLLIIALVYIFTNDKAKKPVGAFLINMSEDELTAKVGIAFYNDYDIREIANRDYVVLKVDRDFDIDRITSTDESYE